jgi:hypothetical protein
LHGGIVLLPALALALLLVLVPKRTAEEKRGRGEHVPGRRGERENVIAMRTPLLPCSTSLRGVWKLFAVFRHY